MKGREGLPDQLPSLAVCAVLAMVGSSGSARAQALTVGSPGPNQFHLTATAGERANTNAFFEEGTPQGDYVSTFQLDLAARRQSPRTNWSLDYRPLLNHYLNFSELDSSSHALDAAANYTLTPRSRLALRELFSVSRDPVLVASPQTGDSPLLNNTFRRSRSSADIGFTRDMSRSISLVAGAQYGLNRFEDPNATDADAYAARLGLAGKVGRADTVTGTYSPGRLHLEPPVPVIPLPTPENPDPHVAQGQGATSHELGVGWNHGTEATWTSELFVDRKSVV